MRNDIIQALDEYEIKTTGNKKNIEKAEALLSSNEKVLFVTPTNLVITATNTRKKEKLPSVVILTDQRILFYYQIMLSSSTEVIALDEIRSINSNTNGMTGGHIELHTMTKSYDILVSYKRDMVQKIVQVFEKAKKDFAASANAPTSTARNNSILEQIEKLSDLNKKGIITDEEFKTKKEELLAKL